MENTDMDKLIEELPDKLGTVFKIKCSIGQYRRWDQVCKEKFADSRHVMLDTLLNFYFDFSETLKKLQETQELIIRLANKVLELEKKVEGGETDGCVGQAKTR